MLPGPLSTHLAHRHSLGEGLLPEPKAGLLLHHQGLPHAESFEGYPTLGSADVLGGQSPLVVALRRAVN